MLTAQALVKRYDGRTVVDHVDLHVAAGTVHGLLGPNGAGKTTVFRMIAGVVPADGGRVTLGNLPLGNLPLHKRARLGLGYLPQEDCLFRELDVAGNVALGAKIPAETALERVGLGGFGKRRVDGLSGGERRRVAIARLLATEPQALLLDEPFSGVDPVAVAGFQQLVRALAESGVAVLITDHAARETLAICDRATVIDGGTVQVEGTPLEVSRDARARARYLGVDFTLPAFARSGEYRYDGDVG